MIMIRFDDIRNSLRWTNQSEIIISYHKFSAIIMRFSINYCFPARFQESHFSFAKREFIRGWIEISYLFLFFSPIRLHSPVEPGKF